MAFLWGILYRLSFLSYKKGGATSFCYKQLKMVYKPVKSSTVYSVGWENLRKPKIRAAIVFKLGNQISV